MDGASLTATCPGPGRATIELQDVAMGVYNFIQMCVRRRNTMNMYLWSLGVFG